MKGISDKFVYSYSTYHSYRNQMCQYINWCKDNGIRLKNIQDFYNHANEWIQYGIDKGLSAYTLALRRSAFIKVFDDKTYKDFIELPPRRRADIKRSRNDSTIFRHFNPDNNKNICLFLRSTGLRRIEVMSLTKDSLKYDEFGNPYLHIYRNTKGGKSRDSVIIGDDSTISKVISIIESSEGDRVFPEGSFPKSTPCHRFRAEYAKALYNQLCETRKIENPKDFVHLRKDRKNESYYRPFLKEVSKSLGHNRIDVVTQHYLY